MNVVSTSLRKILFLTSALLAVDGIGHQTFSRDAFRQELPMITYEEILSDGRVSGAELEWGFYFDQGSGVVKVYCTVGVPQLLVDLLVTDGRLEGPLGQPRRYDIAGAALFLVGDTGFKTDLWLFEVAGSGILSERDYYGGMRSDTPNFLDAILSSNNQMKVKLELDPKEITFTGEINVNETGPETGG